MEQEIKRLKQDETLPETPWIVSKRLDIRLVYLLSIIAPWVGFSLFGTSRFGGAEWQDGQISTYFDLAFAESVWILFAPFLAYSSLAMLLLIWDEAKFSKYWFVRFGVYTGFILALQFTVQIIPTNEVVIGLIVGYIAILPLFGLIWLIPRLYRLTKEKRHNENFWKVIGLIAISLLLFVVGAVLTGVGGGIIGTLILGPLAAGVALCPILAGLTTYRLYTHVEKSLLKNQLIKIVSGVTWLTAYGVATAVAIDRVFELYTQLPSEPPHCYVATASAKGHRPLVNPLPVRMQSGEVMWVTRQLQILKAGELVLRETVPSAHRAMRRVYDWIGPKLANRIQGPWSADVGYLFFKPFELVTLFLLQWLLPNQLAKVERFYTGDPSSI